MRRRIRVSDNRPLSFQNLILTIHDYWSKQGCVILQPYDMRVGAGTFHPATTLRSLGPDKWNCAYVQPSRRPTDGRYGENPNRLQHYYQYQVIMNPSPANLQQLSLGRLTEIWFDPLLQVICFGEVDWDWAPLGCGWRGSEVWFDVSGVTKFT